MCSPFHAQIQRERREKIRLKIVQKVLLTINCMQVTVLLEAAVVFILLAADVTGVTEATCRQTDKRPTQFISIAQSIRKRIMLMLQTLIYYQIWESLVRK